MKQLIGIDEAGLGPTLGPLVLAATRFRVPDSFSVTDLRPRLKGIIGRAGCKKPRLAVDDSKRIFHFGGSIESLEHPIYAFSSAAGNCPLCLDDWFGQGAVPLKDRLSTYPWYQDSHKIRLPRGTQVSEERTRSLAKALSRAGIEFLGFDLLVSFAGELNAQFERIPNKASVHARFIMELLGHAVEKCGEESAEVFVDRLGGRIYYEDLLAATFPFSSIKIERQEPDTSSYKVKYEGQTLSVMFCRKGDSRYLPIALASMAAKWTREVFMSSLNRYFCNAHQGLKPTAGYPQDAKRFLDSIWDWYRERGLDESFLKRSR